MVVILAEIIHHTTPTGDRLYPSGPCLCDGQKDRLEITMYMCIYVYIYMYIYMHVYGYVYACLKSIGGRYRLIQAPSVKLADN